MEIGACFNAEKLDKHEPMLRRVCNVNAAMIAVPGESSSVQTSQEFSSGRRRLPSQSSKKTNLSQNSTELLLTTQVDNHDGGRRRRKKYSTRRAGPSLVDPSAILSERVFEQCDLADIRYDFCGGH
jgi:hypothetical protein